ncbi:YcgL domain-containing protein [Marinobacter caseinilyticus]|uniref:YcgL domain-containing protein n=1 Tax=Marinobacter caseinilyticus TaxID=2692195 RepID=UPI00140BDA77|nr:YcgL domain-containing protein [Marinobacter caseinilyticus]
MIERQFVSVYRSSKSNDTYVYIKRGKAWTELPDTLKLAFGQPVHTMDLLLDRERKLSRSTGEQVLTAIEDQGFFLQMPEKLESYLVEFKQKVRKREQ